MTASNFGPLWEVKNFFLFEARKVGLKFKLLFPCINTISRHCGTLSHDCFPSFLQYLSHARTAPSLLLLLHLGFVPFHFDCHASPAFSLWHKKTLPRSPTYLPPLDNPQPPSTSSSPAPTLFCILVPRPLKSFLSRSPQNTQW